MAWTTPRTWVASELVTASLLNTHVRDNENALRDYLLGAQDLGADWKLSSGRQIHFQDSDVSHGMTGLEPSDNWGAIKQLSATAGGIDFEGYTDADATAARLLGIIGVTNPTVAPVHFFAAKKNGTSFQALAAGELAYTLTNAGTALMHLYGSNGANIIGGLTVGFTGAPTAGELNIGNSLFELKYAASQTPAVIFDSGTSPASGIYYEQTLGVYSINSSAVTSWQMTKTQIGPVSGSAIGWNMNIGAGGTEAPPLSLMFFERADPTAPDANRATLYAKDNGAGKTQLVVLFNSGAVQVLATQP
jgi:hypothetical protein